MGMYSDQAAAFHKGVGRLASQLGGITSGFSSISSELSRIKGDVISENVISGINDYSGEVASIIENLEGIAAEVSAKAQELDEEIERQRKAAEEALAKSKSVKISKPNMNESNVVSLLK